MKDRRDDEVTQKQDAFREQWFQISGKVGRIRYYFNPIIATGTLVAVWGVIIWLLVDSNSRNALNEAKNWITNVSTWLHISQQFIWFILVIYIYFRWGHIKLGKEEDKPDYDDYCYLAMTFCTGTGAPKYILAVNESIFHYHYEDTGNVQVYWGDKGPAGKAQNAIHLNVFHWGIVGFSVYALMSVAISFFAYRKGLPLTMRSCLYPFLGHKIYGRLGDAIDTLTAIATVLGLTVGLAYGSASITQSLHELTGAIDTTKEWRIGTIWVLAGVAIISTVSGIGFGIKHLSVIALTSGICVWLVLLFIDDTWYNLNVVVQTIGYSAQNFLATTLHTGAFSQKGNIPGQSSEAKDWLGDWTLFYWGWWIVLTPMFGIFTARISRGRTIREVIIYTCFLPFLFLVLWFSVFGGIAVDMQFRAEHNNITCDQQWYIDGHRNNSNSQWEVIDAKYGSLDNLDCVAQNAKSIALLKQYGEVSNILYGFLLFSMVLQYVTSADSASLVIDIISANGKYDPPISQRVVWVLTQSATSSAFVKYINEDSIVERAIAIVAAFPFIILINCACVALWRNLKTETVFNLHAEIQEWEMFYGEVKTWKQAKSMVIAIFCPWWLLGKIAIKEQKHRHWFFRVAAYLSFAVPFYSWIVLMIAGAHMKHLDKFGWVCLLMFFLHAAKYRLVLRERSGLIGNLVEDFLVTMLYPLSIVQMYEESEKHSRTLQLPVQSATASVEFHHPKIIAEENSGFEASTVSRNGDVFEI